MRTRGKSVGLHSPPAGKEAEDYSYKELFKIVPGVPGFFRDQFALLAERLGSIKGRFILSINDLPAIRDLFKGFAMEELELTYTVGGGAGRPARELIISNETGEPS